MKNFFAYAVFPFLGAQSHDSPGVELKLELPERVKIEEQFCDIDGGPKPKEPTPGL